LQLLNPSDLFLQVERGIPAMKKIEAILQQSKFNEVQNGLQKIGVDVMTVCEVKGFGPQARHVETYRSQDHTVDFLPKIKIDLVVMEQQAEQVLKVIINCAQKGKAGDDKVFISDIKEAAYMVPI
jgi:nitrogen regulatory protein P-II 1